MNPAGGLRIESGKQAVKRAGAAAFPGGEPVAQRLVARGAFEQAVQEGAQVEAGASGHNGEAFTVRRCRPEPAGQAGIFAGGEKLVGIQDIQKMVGNPPTLGGRQLGGSDIEVAVDLQGIAIDDLAAESGGEGQGQIALAGTGRADHCNQRAFGPTSGAKTSAWEFRGDLRERPRYTIKE